MAKVLRDNSGRLFLSCTSLDGNDAYHDAQLSQEELPVALRDQSRPTQTQRRRANTPTIDRSVPPPLEK